MNVVLIGMMGCGKSTVAETFSKFYGYKKVDTDEMIVSRYGQINGIFERFGENYFRDLESKIVEEVVLISDGAVISVGGGCVLRDKNVKTLKQNGVTVYLRTRAETIIKRLEGNGDRPLLKGELAGRVNEILSSRSKVYESAADIIIDTDGLSPEEIAKKIKENIV